MTTAATDTMGIMKASCRNPMAGCDQLGNLKIRAVIFASILYLIQAGQFASARTTFTPTFEIRGVAVDNSFDSFSENGYVTTVSPGFTVVSEGPRSDFLMIYAYDDIRSHDLEEGDRDIHQLNLSSEIRHRPGWASYAKADNRLVNGDIDGIQSTAPDIIGENSEELFTADVGSTYADRLTRNTQYSAGFSLDYSDREDSDRTTGREATVVVDNFVSGNLLTWRVQLQTSVAEDDDSDQQIDELEILLNYEFDESLSTFVEFTATETDFDDLNDDSVLVGLRWSPTRQSFLSVGIGERGDEETYDLDASIISARTRFFATYSESVTSVRDQLFDDSEELFGESTQQSTSIDPILRKRADVGVGFTGVRSTINFSFFYDEESNPNSSLDEETTGVEISYIRRLSLYSSLSLTALTQDTEFEQDSTLDEFRVSYQKSTSKTAGFEIFASNASFESSDESNEYDQVTAGALYRIAF